MCPSSLRGTITVPSSKSMAHRALIASFLAGGGRVTINGISEDIAATQNALVALQSGEKMINCAASATTLRLLIPVAAALGRTVTFSGGEQLSGRPVDEYRRLLPQHGVRCDYDERLPLTVSGQLKAGRFAVAGNISSQYISGLLLALPLLSDDSELVLTTPLQSKPYVDMTIQVLRDFDVTITPTESGYNIPGNQHYQPRDYRVEGDWSQAAFFLAGGALNSDVTVTGLRSASVQGDRVIVDILQRFGAGVTYTPDGVRAVCSSLHGITVNVRDMPDTVPAIAAVAAYAEGTTVISGAERLRFKESDRIHSIVTNLLKAGIRAQATSDGLIIKGGHPHGAVFDGCRDHRIVMAMSMLALAADGATQISDAQSVCKSYPAFFNDYNALGGRANVISDGE